MLGMVRIGSELFGMEGEGSGRERRGRTGMEGAEIPITIASKSKGGIGVTYPSGAETRHTVTNRILPRCY
jgi:hypothetical protein